MIDSHVQAAVALAFMALCVYMATGKKMPADSRLMLGVCAWLLACYAAWCVRDKIDWFWPALVAVGLLELGLLVVNYESKKEPAPSVPSRQGG